MKTQHTPTLSYSDGSLWGISPLNAKVRLADMRKHLPINGIDQEANAAFIVSAVNTHDDLVAALEAVDKLWDGEQGYIAETKCCEQLDFESPVLVVHRMIRAALAKARGEE